MAAMIGCVLGECCPQCPDHVVLAIATPDGLGVAFPHFPAAEWAALTDDRKAAILSGYRVRELDDRLTGRRAIRRAARVMA